MISKPILSLALIYILSHKCLVDSEQYQELEGSYKSELCDTDQCDSIISKCSITKRCLCDFKNDAPCAKDCIDCLEEKFGKCCPCIVQDEIHPSHVGHTSAFDEQFFEVLTEDDDIHGRWTSMSQTKGLKVKHPQLGHLEIAYRRANGSDNQVNPIISHDKMSEKLKCTIAFINRHLSLAKCRRSCTTMGASFFRWFHDGCCECIGRYCVGYGLSEPKCQIEDVWD